MNGGTLNSLEVATNRPKISLKVKTITLKAHLRIWNRSQMNRNRRNAAILGKYLATYFHTHCTQLPSRIHLGYRVYIIQYMDIIRFLPVHVQVLKVSSILLLCLKSIFVLVGGSKIVSSTKNCFVQIDNPKQCHTFTDCFLRILHFS